MRVQIEKPELIEASFASSKRLTKYFRSLRQNCKQDLIDAWFANRKNLSANYSILEAEIFLLP
jgi:hypothetical protein